MQEHRHSIYILFKEGIDPSWSNSLDVEDFLALMKLVIFDADYFYEFYDSDYESTVKEAQQKALEQASRGKTLYTITDDPDTVHWLAIKKGYYPLVNMYRKKYANPTYIDSLESFNPKDMII